MTFADILSQFILPAIVGGFGGFATNWVVWDIEKRRTRHTRRVQLIDSWRADLIGRLDEAAVSRGGGDLNFAFMSWPVYASLRPHLSTATVHKIEGPQRTIFIAADFPRRDLIEEIGAIERKWKLA